MSTSSLVITTQVYPPETHPTAVMVHDLARHMVRHGWRVTVCAGQPHHPGGNLYPGWKWKAWNLSTEDGVAVCRVGHLVHGARSIAVRGAVYLSQALATALAASAFPADVVLVVGPPLVGADLGTVVAGTRGAGLVNVVYDLYPDIAVETGRITNPVVVWAARMAESLQYRAADITVVPSEGFKQTLLSKGVPREKIAVVPVWLDPDEIRPGDRDNEWRRSCGMGPEKFVVLYAGTIGVVSGARVVADTAAMLRDREEIEFVFVGEGEERLCVEKRVAELGLSNVHFLPFQPRCRLVDVLASGDVGLLTLAPNRGRTSVPSKLVGYMAAGRPVIGSVDLMSDTARDIEAGDCGLVVPPGDARALAEAVLRMASGSLDLQGLGRNARAYFERHYSRPEVLQRFGDVLVSAASGRRRRCDS